MERGRTVASPTSTSPWPDGSTIVITSVESSDHAARTSAPSGALKLSMSYGHKRAPGGGCEATGAHVSTGRLHGSLESVVNRALRPPRSVAKSNVTVSVSPPPYTASPLSKSSAANETIMGPRVLP